MKIAKNFPKLMTECPQIKGQRTPSGINTKKAIYEQIMVNMLKTKGKEKILKGIKEKGHITYWKTMTRIMADFSSEIRKAKNNGTISFKGLKEKHCQP